MRRRAAGLGLLITLASLAACGTDVRYLVREESRTFWINERIIGLAEAEGLAEVETVYAAEAAKERACAVVTEATEARLFATGGGFWAGLWSDLREFAVSVFPVPAVERCAEAHARYRQAVAALCRTLRARGHDLECPAPDPAGQRD